MNGTNIEGGGQRSGLSRTAEEKECRTLVEGGGDDDGFKICESAAHSPGPPGGSSSRRNHCGGGGGIEWIRDPLSALKVRKAKCLERGRLRLQGGGLMF